MIQFSILGWGNSPGLSTWAHCHHNSPYRRDSGGIRGDDNIMMGAEVGVMHLENGGRDHKPRSRGSHEQLEKRHRDGFFLRVSRKTSPADTSTVAQ